MSEDRYTDGYDGHDAYVESRRQVWNVASWQLLLAVIAPLGAALIVWWNLS